MRLIIKNNNSKLYKKPLLYRKQRFLVDLHVFKTQSFLQNTMKKKK